MTKVFAIAGLAVRTAVRSRLFVSLIVLLMLVLVGLPLCVKGDGTMGGRIEVLLSYTLGLSTFVLAAATLWASCGAVSGEISEKQIRLVVVKPVHRIQIWLGKWVGMLLINAFLLSAVGMATCLLVLWTLRPGAAGEGERQQVRQEVLVGRQRIHPRVGAVDEAARRDVKQIVDEKMLPRELAASAYRHIRTRMLTAEFTVAPSRTRSWIFEVPAGHDKQADVTFRFHLSSSYRNRNPVTGTWTLGPEGSRPAFRFPIKDCVSGPHVVRVPSRLLASGRPLVLTFENGPEGLSTAAVFDFERGIELLVRRSRFGPNFGRALIIVFCFLAFLAALGLTMGTLVSFPVATFMGVAVLLIALMSHTFTIAVLEDNPFLRWEQNRTPEFVYALGEHIMRSVDVAVAPVMAMNPLRRLSAGILISWKTTGLAALMLLLGYPALLGLISGWFLKRRELAL